MSVFSLSSLRVAARVAVFAALTAGAGRASAGA